jgi:hypothetical protein
MALEAHGAVALHEAKKKREKITEKKRAQNNSLWMLVYFRCGYNHTPQMNAISAPYGVHSRTLAGFKTVASCVVLLVWAC